MIQFRKRVKPSFVKREGQTMAYSLQVALVALLLSSLVGHGCSGRRGNAASECSEPEDIDDLDEKESPFQQAQQSPASLR